MPTPRSLTRTAARLVAAATTAALALTLAPAAPATAAPATAAPASASDGIRDRQLDRLTEAVHDKGAVGVVARLVTPDGTWSGAAGANELSPRLPATTDARFRAASVTKMVTTVLALQLVARDRWTLRTTIDDVLPGLYPGRGDVTLRQLLSHTSGLPDYLPPLIGDATTSAQLVAAVSRPREDERLVRLAQQAEPTPRGEYAYANTNFVVVGMMVREATGRSLASLARDRVFAPAGMSRSAWPTTVDTTRPRLQEWARLGGRLRSFATFNPTTFSGAGALLTTTRDLDRFQLALSRGDLLPLPLVRRMRGVTSDGGAAGIAYGLGSYRLPDPCRPGRYVHGHDGASFATLTLSFASPSGARRVTVAMTGRDLDGRQGSATALSRLAFTALAQTCGGDLPTGARVASPARLAALTASAG